MVYGTWVPEASEKRHYKVTSGSCDLPRLIADLRYVSGCALSVAAHQKVDGCISDHGPREVADEDIGTWGSSLKQFVRPSLVRCHIGQVCCYLGREPSGPRQKEDPIVTRS